MPRGVVVQPLYRLLVRKDGTTISSQLRAQPLELKVHCLFGLVVCGTVNTNPSELWVTHDGMLYVWTDAELRRLAAMRGSRQSRRRVHVEVIEALELELERHWPFIHDHTVRLCRGLDEVRVDWLLGDDAWGPRVGEVCLAVSDCKRVALCGDMPCRVVPYCTTVRRPLVAALPTASDHWGACCAHGQPG